jgi:multiple sugar transport system permease protein
MLQVPVPPQVQEKAKETRRSNGIEARETRAFWLFLIPWIIGFICFTGGPILATFGFSLTDYTGIGTPDIVGLGNYTSLFTDPLFLKSLSVTLYYTLIALPASLILALILALLLNRRVLARGVLRTIFYLPTVVSGVAVALLWQWLLNPDFGLMNYALSFLHINGIDWFLDERTVIPAFAIMSLWGCGGAMVVFMASLQGIPAEQYEAASIDGAGSWHKFWGITLPLISPAILFNLVTGMIVSLQIFVPGYIITQGGPNFASEFYVLYLFNNAFQNFKFGYASAQAFILFLIILVLTALLLRVSSRFVYYEEA